MIGKIESSTIDTIVRILKGCRSLLFVTGAGVSAESGVPTYRGVGGLYNVETTEEGYPIEEILSASMLAENPALTWKYLAQIGLAAKDATHNRAHEVIAEMESHFARVWTMTQNVDGFHRSAGSHNLVEAHGNMNSFYCMECQEPAKLEAFEQNDQPPQCATCGGMIRPDVVLFGEMITGRGLEELQQQAMLGFDIVFTVGTSSAFPYIQAPIHMAKGAGVPTVEINPSATVMTPLVDYHLPLGAAVALDEIWRRFQVS